MDVPIKASQDEILSKFARLIIAKAKADKKRGITVIKDDKK